MSYAEQVANLTHDAFVNGYLIKFLIEFIYQLGFAVGMIFTAAILAYATRRTRP